GFTLTHPSTGGVYAFEPSVPGNRALGIQAGTGDWAPGHLTLRIQNQTGVVINTLMVQYALYIFNNADRSSEFRFSWSTDNLQYNDVASLQYQSLAAADLQPVWDVKDQSIKMEGLSIPPGAWFYVRWSGSDISGTGSRDEFALDDIRFVANPVSGNPLPVRFTTLRAMEQPGGMLVSFETQLEENLEYYILERSLDGRVFFPLKQFSAKNNGAHVNLYSFLDQQTASGIVYYRVRSAEINGQVTYSKILRISAKPVTKGLILYPNPVTDELVLQLGKLPAGRYNIWIHDAAGVVVMEKKLELKGGAHTETMTVGSLQAGWYSLRLSGPAALYRVFVKH
ncbi:MAG: T9SS type A sorting domain-containing protein, partial [Flavisolibacter sp.]